MASSYAVLPVFSTVLNIPKIKKSKNQKKYVLHYHLLFWINIFAKNNEAILFLYGVFSPAARCLYTYIDVQRPKLLLLFLYNYLVYQPIISIIQTDDALLYHFRYWVKWIHVTRGIWTGAGPKGGGDIATRNLIIF